jgi:ATP-dependent RNA helicase RhlE
MRFSDLNLSKPLLQALDALGMDTPTPIQERAFPVIMSGRDVVGIAQTGTGKTFAYLLPLVRLLPFNQQKEPRILILVPTRELVVQVTEEVKKLGAFMTIRVEGVYGGTNINTQKGNVSGGLDILVGTPGRVMDLALTHVLSLKKVKHFVLDEVDEMMNQGFRSQLLTILDLLSQKRQNLMFSATMTEDVDKIIHDFFQDPVPVEPVRAGTPLARIEQFCYAAPNFYTKLNLLAYLLKNDESMTRLLIFGASKRHVDMIHDHLEREFPEQFEVIHSNKSQNFRLNAVSQMKEGSIRGLIATDLLARGIDVVDITHVINIDVPTEAETYIHRIGRTGRADADGKAIVFFTEAEAEAMLEIEVLMEKEIPILELPEAVGISNQLLDEERPGIGDKAYLPKLVSRSGGAYHDKSDKRKKVNKGSKEVNFKRAKYKTPITRGMKRKKGS